MDVVGHLAGHNSVDITTNGRQSCYWTLHVQLDSGPVLELKHVIGQYHMCINKWDVVRPWTESQTADMQLLVNRHVAVFLVVTHPGQCRWREIFC